MNQVVFYRKAFQSKMLYAVLLPPLVCFALHGLVTMFK